MAFKADIHDFGTLEEGPAADHVFTFTNTGKEPLTIQRVQASCGCTTPEWTKDPIQPGQTGIVKASYGTAGRPGHFEKTLTVFSNAGTKTLTIKGDVEKAPESSAPQNTSMIRTN
jgi:3,4-dihydroxy-2-butanone 4-phosphate synthase